jgi:hypothetical protein
MFDFHSLELESITALCCNENERNVCTMVGGRLLVEHITCTNIAVWVPEELRIYFSLPKDSTVEANNMRYAQCSMRVDAAIEDGLRVGTFNFTNSVWEALCRCDEEVDHIVPLIPIDVPAAAPEAEDDTITTAAVVLGGTASMAYGSNDDENEGDDDINDDENDDEDNEDEEEEDMCGVKEALHWVLELSKKPGAKVFTEVRRSQFDECITATLAVLRDQRKLELNQS